MRKSVRQEIEDLLLYLEVPKTLLGFGLMVEAIEMSLKDGYITNSEIYKRLTISFKVKKPKNAENALRIASASVNLKKWERLGQKSVGVSHVVNGCAEIIKSKNFKIKGEVSNE